MSPSVFLPTMEEGNSIYKGQCRTVSVGGSGSLCPPQALAPHPPLLGNAGPVQTGSSEPGPAAASSFKPLRVPCRPLVGENSDRARVDLHPHST